MKSIKIYLGLIAILFATAFISCSDSDDDVKPTPTPTPTPEATTHFDIWVTTSSYGGAGSNVEATLVQGVNSLETENVVSFIGKGVDVTAKLFQESIIKGEYYYQVPQEKDRFGKYKITEKGIEVVKEFAFKNNTLLDRRYSHAWTGDNTLVLLAANGDKSKIIWIKVDTENMKIISEGELDIPALSAGGQLNTSGMANYRKADNTLIYLYQDNKDKTHFYTAFINPDDMSIKSTIVEKRAEQIGNSAYGELLTQKGVFDSEGNYYLVATNQIEGGTSTQQYSTLLRINKGAYEFDKNYIGYQGKDYPRGKVVTIDYLTTNKLLLYILEPTFTGSGGWGKEFYNCFYAVLDIDTDKLTVLDLPFNQGVLSQRSLVLGDKAYIGINPKDEDQAIYSYDIKTGSLTKKITLEKGFEFQRITKLEK